MNTENIPGMCFDQSHARPCNRRKRMGSQSQNRVHLYLTEIESAIPFYLRATRTTQEKIGLSAFGE